MTTTLTESVTVAREVLQTALGRCAMVLPKRDVVPVVQCVRIAPEGEGLRLTTTDFDRTLSVFVPCEGADLFPTLVVPCARLAAIVAQLPPGVVTLAAHGKGVRITSGRSRFDVGGFAADEFPANTNADETATTSTAIDGAAFALAVSRCLGFVSREGGVTTLEGVHVSAPLNGSIEIQASDRHQLNREFLDRTAGPALDFILPAASVGVIAKLFADAERLTIEIREQNAVITTEDGSVALATRLIQGVFPPTAQWWRLELPHTATVDRVALLAAAKRLAAVSTKETLIARMEWAHDHVTLSGVGDEGNGASEDVVPCDATNSEPIRISFAPRLLIQGLAIRNDATIRISYEDGNAPMRLRDAESPVDQNLIAPRRELGAKEK